MGRGDTVLVAVSGGVDSVVLLHLLHTLAKPLQITLHVAHLDHGLRGDASATDRRFTEQLCERLRLPITSARQDCTPRAGESPQQAARRVRRHFLQTVQHDVGAQVIATGHHADDQAETVLMRLLNGAGLTGLAAMRPRQGDYVRPLLSLPKQLLTDYAADKDLPHVQDLSNDDPRYLRNRLRLQVMPQLKAINPNLLDTLGRQARLLAEVDSLLSPTVAETLASLQRPDDPSLDRAALAALAPGMARLVLFDWLQRHAGGSIATCHVDAVYDMACGATGRGIDLPGSQRAEAVYDRLMLRTPQVVVAEPIVLQVPGTTRIPWAGVSVEAELTSHGPRTGWLRFDPALAETPLLVRARQPGDRFQPAGMGGHSRSLKRFLIDRKIPRHLRDRVALVTHPHGIVWVVGNRQDERYVVKRGLSSALAMRTVPDTTASADTHHHF